MQILFRDPRRDAQLQVCKIAGGLLARKKTTSNLALDVALTLVQRRQTLGQRQGNVFSWLCNQSDKFGVMSEKIDGRKWFRVRTMLLGR